MPLADEDLRPYLVKLRVLWLVFTYVVAIYACVVWFIRRNGWESLAVPEMLVMILAACGIVASIMSFLIKRLLLAPERVARLGGGTDLQKAMQILTGAMIIVWASAEACALMGLVIGLVSDRVALAYILMGAGWAFTLSHSPTETFVRDYLHSVEIAHQRMQT